MRRARRGPGGWPMPPALAPAWMARRALWWLRLMRAGRVQRFHGDLTGLARRRTAPRPGHRKLFAYGDALRQEWRSRVQAGPAGPALLRAGHPNYLGSRAVVRGLVDGYVALLIARAGGVVPYEACVAEMQRLSRIFGGAEPEFPVIGGWNTAGQLGDAAIRRMPLDPAPADSTRLDAILPEAFAGFGLATLRILRAAEQPGIGPDTALTRLSELAERMTALLLGVADTSPPEVTVLAVVADLPELDG